VLPGETGWLTLGRNVGRPSGALVVMMGVYVSVLAFFHPPYIGKDSSGITEVTTPLPKAAALTPGPVVVMAYCV
jgi:hypothetical protein